MKIEDNLIELKKDFINYPVEIKFLKEPSCNGDIAKHEINLIDFKCKKSYRNNKHCRTKQ